MAGLVISMIWLAAGLVTGFYLAHQSPALGRTGASAAASDWLGLPTLIDRGVVQPVDALARAAAQADDRLLDAGLNATAAFADALSQLADRFGEAASDGLPEGTANIFGLLGRDSRRLQTGLSHHYYAYIIGGIFVVAAILAAGA